MITTITPTESIFAKNYQATLPVLPPMSQLLQKCPEKSGQKNAHQNVAREGTEMTDRVHTTSFVSNGVELPWPLYSERVLPQEPKTQQQQLSHPCKEQLLSFK